VAAPVRALNRPRHGVTAGRLRRGAFGALLSAALAGAAVAAPAWPDKPVHLIVAFAAGGAHDALARVIQPRLAAALGQPLVIDNRSGAGGNIAAEAVAKSPPDGFTLLVASEAMATHPALYPALHYEPLRDLAPVTKLADFPIALVTRTGLPSGSVRELVSLARGRPGELSYGSAGIGTSGHLAGELFQRTAGIALAHVPYKGGGPALTDLLAGRIDLMFLSVSLAAPQLRQGKLKAVAIAAEDPTPLLPGVPSMSASGYPGFEAHLFSAVFAPAGTPEPVLRRLAGDIAGALADAEVRRRVEELGGVPAARGPDALRRELEDRARRWGGLIREKNIHAE